MELVKRNVNLRASKINGMYIFFLLIGTAIRIPVGTTVTITLSEVLLVFTIILLPVLIKGGLIKFTRLEIKLLPIIMFVIILLVIQVFIHYNRALSVILLFQYLFIGIFFLFIFNRIQFSHLSYYKALTAFSLYLGISSFYFDVLNYDIGQLRGVLKFGSANYSSAVMLIIIPVIFFYMKQNISRKVDALAYIALLLMTIGIVFSGSRSNIIVLLFQLVFIVLFIQNSIIGKANIILSSLIIALIGYFSVITINPSLYFLIERYLVFFGADASARNDIIFSDIARNNLRNEAIYLINENRFFGTGFARIPTSDVPVHNFLYEILLGLGFVGLVTYLIYVANFFTVLYRRIKKNVLVSKLMLMLTVSFYLISWVHPFMTTGKEFVFIFWLNIIALYDYAKKHESR